MNTTFKEIIYNIKNLRQAGRQSQDALLQDSQYAFIIDYYRSILIERLVNSKRELPAVVQQTIEVPFRRVKSMEEDIFSDKRVYKAVIPSVIQTNDKPLYSSIRKSMFSPTLDRSTSFSIRHDLNSPTTGDAIRWFPEGNAIYVITPNPLEKLFVTAVFEHPLEVEEWKADNNQSNNFNIFDPYNFEYPLPLKLIDALYKMMTDGEIKFSLLTPNDIRADGVEEGGGKLPDRKSKSDDTE